MQRLVALACELRDRCVLGNVRENTRGLRRIAPRRLDACLRRLATGLAPLHSLRPCLAWYAANTHAKRAPAAACLRTGNLPKYWNAPRSRDGQPAQEIGCRAKYPC